MLILKCDSFSLFYMLVPHDVNFKVWLLYIVVLYDVNFKMRLFQFGLCGSTS